MTDFRLWRPGPAWVCAAILLLAAIQLAPALLHYRDGLYWDLAVYRHAVLGPANPYAGQGPLLFVYHPAVLDVLRLFGGQIAFVLLIAYMACALVLAMGVRRFADAGLAIGAGMAFSGLGVLSVASGNATPFLHLLLIGIVGLDVRRPDMRRCFFACLFVATVVKPYMLAYILLPFVPPLLARAQRRAAAIEALALLGLLAVLALAYVAWQPEQMRSFLDALRAQTVARGDLGISLFARLTQLSSRPQAILLALHLAATGGLFVAMAWLGWRRGWAEAAGFPWLLYFLLTLINPRLKEYDLAPAMVALFLFFANIGAGRRGLWLILLAMIPAAIRDVNVRFLASASDFWARPFNAYYLSMAAALGGLALFRAEAAGSPRHR